MSDSPEKVRIGGLVGMWFLPGILLLVGVVLVIVSFIM